MNSEKRKLEYGEVTKIACGDMNIRVYDTKDAIAKKAKETTDSVKKSVNARVDEVKQATKDKMTKK